MCLTTCNAPFQPYIDEIFVTLRGDLFFKFLERFEAFVVRFLNFLALFFVVKLLGRIITFVIFSCLSCVCVHIPVLVSNVENTFPDYILEYIFLSRGLKIT